MRVLVAELAPTLLDFDANVARIEAIVGSASSDLAVFPELYLTGYRVGDRVGEVALGEEDPRHRKLLEIAARSGTTLVVGGPRRSPERPGETENAALCYGPDGSFSAQAKRFLPTFGPFEEGSLFSPTEESRPVRAVGRSVGLEICYDLFFPEVSRELALAGAELLVGISAAPVTSRRLFERVLPARAIENALPIVYVNRVGVEDGLVFGGGSVVLDPRGEEVRGEKVEGASQGPDERIELVELDLGAASRWRPFRPVLRDVAQRRRSERAPG